MLRNCAWSLVVVVTFTPLASAEKITFQRHTQQVSALTDLSVDSLLADPVFQQSVIDAAPDGWRDTLGADIWWTPFDGASYKVLVLPAPSKGQPGWHFEVDGTEFWMRIQGIVPATTNGGAALPPGSGTNEQLPGGSAVDEHPSQGAGNGNSSGGANDLPNDPKDPLTVPSDDAGSLDPIGSLENPTTPQAASDGDPRGPGLVIAQAPEPSLLVLLGLAGVSVARRFRRR